MGLTGNGLKDQKGGTWDGEPAGMPVFRKNGICGLS